MGDASVRDCIEVQTMPFFAMRVGLMLVRMVRRLVTDVDICMSCSVVEVEYVKRVFLDLFLFRVAIALRWVNVLKVEYLVCAPFVFVLTRGESPTVRLRWRRSMFIKDATFQKSSGF